MARTRAEPAAPTPPPAVAFIAAPGSNYRDTDAQIIGPELARIARDNDQATNETIVEAARDPNSPLRPYIFKYTDREAADKVRLDLAGQIVRSILIEFEAGGTKYTKRAFEYIEIVYLPPEGTPDGEEVADEDLVPTCHPRSVQGRRRQRRRIVSASYVMEHVDAEAQVIETCAQQLAMFTNKHEGYLVTSPEFRAQFQEVFDAIRAMFARRRRNRPPGQ